MKKLIIPSLLITTSINSFANVTACRATMHKETQDAPQEQSAPASLPDLDALFAQLEESNAQAASETVAPAQSHQNVQHTEERHSTKQVTSGPKLADLTPETLKSMSTLELLNGIDITPQVTLGRNYTNEFAKQTAIYQLRLAISEILHQQKTNSSQQIREDYKELLEAVEEDSLSDRQKVHIEKYSALFQSLINSSQAVKRWAIMAAYDGNDAPQVVSDLFVTKAPPKVVEEEVGFFGKLFGTKKSQVVQEVVIPYENPEQYARALLEKSAEERVTIIKKQSPKMGLLSHLEIYRILMTIDQSQQLQVYQTLKQNLIGRIDFYPMGVLKLAADIDSVAALDVKPIKPEIILGDLKETGQNLDLFEVYHFLKTLDFNSSDISSAMVGRKLSYEQLETFARAEGTQIPFDDMLAFSRIFIHSSPDVGTIEKGRRLLKEIFPDPDLVAAIDNYFDREVRETAFRVQQMIAKLHPETLKANELYEKLTLLVSEVQYLKPLEANMLMNMIPGEAFYTAEGDAIAQMTDQEVDFFLNFRAGLRDSPFHNDREYKWTASDLPALHVSKNLELAHQILVKTKGAMTEDVRAQLGTQLNRLIKQSKLHEPAENELNPIKEFRGISHRPMRKRGVTAAALVEYLHYRVAHL